MPSYFSPISASLSRCSSGRVGPELLAHPLVQPLGERLGEPVGQRLEQDRAVVVVGLLERRDPLGRAEPRGDREGADVVAQPGLPGCDEVGQRLARRPVAALGLLPQLVQRREDGAARLVGVDLDVVAVHLVGREQPEDAVGPQPLLLDDAVEHRLGVLVQPAGGLPAGGVVQDVGEPAAHLPGVEERLPVDVAAQLLERVVGKAAHELRGHVVQVVAAGTGAHVHRLLQQHPRPRRVVAAPVDRRSPPRGRRRSAAASGCPGGRRAARAAPRSRPRSRPAASAAARPTAGRRPPAPTARRPSPRSTGPWYFCATLTAVCAREVVAPPISSGISKPCRSISDARLTISSSDGVISPERPMMSAPSCLGGVEDLLRRAP